MREHQSFRCRLVNIGASYKQLKFCMGLKNHEVFFFLLRITEIIGGGEGAGEPIFCHRRQCKIHYQLPGLMSHVQYKN